MPKKEEVDLWKQWPRKFSENIVFENYARANLVTILAPGPADVHPDDMTVAIDEDLEVVEECSVDKVHEVKKEFILTDFIICFQTISHFLRILDMVGMRDRM